MGYESTWRSPSEWQEFRIKRHASAPATRRLWLRHRFWDASSSQWSTYQTKFTASFEFIDVGNVKDHLYCLGTNVRDGSMMHVIEYWRVVPEAVPIGAPPEWNVNREQLYRSNTLGEIRLVEVDPEQRFLLLVHEQNGVSRMSSMALTGDNPITELYSEAALPTLRDITEVGRHQHRTEGRMWFFSDIRSDYVTILFDATNDAIFESELVVDYATGTTLGYINDLTDDFKGP